MKESELPRSSSKQRNNKAIMEEVREVGEVGEVGEIVVMLCCNKPQYSHINLTLEAFQYTLC